MSVKVHLLDSHLDFTPEHLHQDIEEIERRYQGKWNPNMLTNYILVTRKGHF